MKIIMIVIVLVLSVTVVHCSQRTIRYHHHHRQAVKVIDWHKFWYDEFIKNGRKEYDPGLGDG
jgi:hypothetical protein